LVVRETQAEAISNFVIFSDDNAKTWTVSTSRAADNGNEAKVVELTNGDLLMSIRSQGKRKFSISADQGCTWNDSNAQSQITDPSCNGDMIRYPSIFEEFGKDRILHSIPLADSRSNVSVLLSYDEGATWMVRKSVYPGLSAYSSLCCLDDGTIGIYYEVGEYETYQMYFVRFSLNWLTDGNDTWTDKWTRKIDPYIRITKTSPTYKIYPNPTVSTLYAEGPFGSNSHIEVLNSNGVLLDSYYVEGQQTRIQLSMHGYPAGIYFFKVNKEMLKFVFTGNSQGF
jgi:hypothetical protein